jgi:hypothetical protein
VRITGLLNLNLGHKHQRIHKPTLIRHDFHEVLTNGYPILWLHFLIKSSQERARLIAQNNGLQWLILCHGQDEFI